MPSVAIPLLNLQLMLILFGKTAEGFGRWGVLVFYLVAINVVTFFVYGLDKLKAKKRWWRIPEAVLLTLAAIGGSVGAWLGMKVWHHKTAHNVFRYGIPLILAIQIALFILFSCGRKPQAVETPRILEQNLIKENKAIMEAASKYIAKLGLLPHPEGGWYRQLYGNDENGKKEISTIYYMLCDEDYSAFHRLHDMVEIWYYHDGEPLDIYVITPNGELTVHHLSADAEMQVVIEPEQWFAAELPGKKGFSLVGCAVAPAFIFENFELAKKEELLDSYPQHKALIERMCR